MKEGREQEGKRKREQAGGRVGEGEKHITSLET